MLVQLTLQVSKKSVIVGKFFCTFAPRIRQFKTDAPMVYNGGLIEMKKYLIVLSALVLLAFSNAYIHCDGSIKVNLSGASDLHFTGTAFTGDSSTSGASDIIHDVLP